MIQLKMNAKTLPNTISRNTVVEILGSVRNESAVIVSGHLDSWDVGEGAMDDGAGAFISWASLVVLKRLGLRAKRTIRLIINISVILRLMFLIQSGFVDSRRRRTCRCNSLR